MRYAILVLPLLAACSNPKKARFDEENRNLVARHTDIWKMMGLSAKAQEELNAVVLGVNRNIQVNRDRDPEKFRAIQPKRDAKWQEHTKEEFFARHKERFAKVGLSEATQKELLGAMEVVWAALRDPNVPEKDKEPARKIQEMMKQLPACCDDSIFEKASAK